MTRGVLLLATMLTGVAACDKTKEDAAAGASAAAVPPDTSAAAGSAGAAPPATFTADTVTGYLFLVFGGRDDPRMLPVAKIGRGTIEPVARNEDQWRFFDSRYFRSGRMYPLYREGRQAGMVTIRRGMWERPDSVLYALPNCVSHMPLAAVSVPPAAAVGSTVEALASSMELRSAAPGPLPDSATLTSIGHSVGRYVGARNGIPRAALDSLDFGAQAITTGAGTQPTLVLSFVDPRSDDSDPKRQTAHVFVVAEASAKGYIANYTHTASGRVGRAEYRRLLDHLDLDHDGVDELILEGWTHGQSTFPLILKWRNGSWDELYRGRSTWCLDR